MNKSRKRARTDISTSTSMNSHYIATTANINQTIQQLNKCITNWYERYGNDIYKTYMEADFKACCNKKEIKILKYCFKQYIDNNPDENPENVLKALIEYYYSVQVLENNVLENVEKQFKITKQMWDGRYKDNFDNYYSHRQLKQNHPLIQTVDLELTDENADPDEKFYINSSEPFPKTLYHIDNDTDELTKTYERGFHFSCLLDFTNADATRILRDILVGNDEYHSNIRRRVINMNSAEFIDFVPQPRTKKRVRIRVHKTKSSRNKAKSAKTHLRFSL